MVDEDVKNSDIGFGLCTQAKKHLLIVANRAFQAKIACKHKASDPSKKHWIQNAESKLIQC